METPGEYLSRERELRGVTVHDMVEALKLSDKLVTALEHDDHETLPHPTYVKGFVRAYAVYLGIDEEDAVLRYEAYQNDRRLEAEKVKKFKAESASGYEASPTMPRMASSGRVDGFALGGLLGRGRRGNNRTVVAFVAAGILIVVLYFLFSGGGGSDTPEVVKAPAEEVKKVATAEPPAKEPVKKVKKEAKPKAVKAVEVSKAVPAVKPPATVKKDLFLEVVASDTTWVGVDIDGKEQREALLQPGETVRWRGAKVFF